MTFPVCIYGLIWVRTMRRILFIALVASFFTADGLTTCEIAAQQQIRVTVENLQINGGFYFTPVWFGIHDGNFDLFDAGSASSSSLESLAELGDVSGIQTDFSNAGFTEQGVVLAPNGFAGAPVFDPTDSGSATIVINATNTDRFFSFASMLIPSNDVFFGNGDPQSIELFDTSGNFNGNQTIDIFGNNLYDAGTEVTDSNFAAFVAGANAPGGTDQNGVADRFDSQGEFDAFNAEFVNNGLSTPAGTSITNNLSAGSSIARITITAIPEPTSFSVIGLAALAGFGLIRRRRR